MKLEKYRQRADRYKSDYDHARRSVEEERHVLDRAEHQHKSALAARDLLQRVAETVQQAAHTRIATVVTKCLAAVFGEDAYEFRILFERKRGKTEAVCVFHRNGAEVDPLGAAGGGVVDVAAFALRIACLVLMQPAPRRIVIADEPFRFISAEYRPRVREMIEMLADELGIQFILVTHSPEFEIGKVIEL